MVEEQVPARPNYDHERWVHELKREDAQRAHDRLDDFAQATNNAAVDNANLALRYAVLINGGAAVAVLGFIGALAGHDHITNTGLLSTKLIDAASALTWFAIGVGAATLAMGFSYFTNYAIAANASSLTKLPEHPWSEQNAASRWWQRIALSCQVIAILLGFGSVALFIGGMWAVKDAITRLV